MSNSKSAIPFGPSDPAGTMDSGTPQHAASQQHITNRPHAYPRQLPQHQGSNIGSLSGHGHDSCDGDTNGDDDDDEEDLENGRGTVNDNANKENGNRSGSRNGQGKGNRRRRRSSDSAEPPPLHPGRNPACDLCREKKVRCGREKPSCHNCKIWKVACKYSERVKRDSEATRSAQRFEEVTERLERIESTMATLIGTIERLTNAISESTGNNLRTLSPGQQQTFQHSPWPVDTISNTPPSNSTSSNLASVAPAHPQPQNTLVISSAGSLHYLGSSSLLSITQDAESLIRAGKRGINGKADRDSPRKETIGALSMLTDADVDSNESGKTQNGRKSQSMQNQNRQQSEVGPESHDDTFANPSHMNGDGTGECILSSIGKHPARPEKTKFAGFNYSNRYIGLATPDQDNGLYWKDGLELDFGTPEASGKMYLPSFSIVQQLVDRYFRKVYTCVPLFNEDLFRERLKHTYEAIAGTAGAPFNPAQERGWLACVNSVLLFGAYSEAVNKKTNVHKQLAEWLFFNSWTAIDDISVLMDERIENIQALVAGAITAVEISRPGLCWNLLSHACRLAMATGLHRKITLRIGDYHDRSTEVTKRLQERKYVFWNLYILDTTLSLTFGRPTCLPDYDCDIELPDDDGTNPMYNHFTALTRLSRIKSHIYARLYSASAGRMGAEERTAVIRELDQELREWWKADGEKVGQANQRREEDRSTKSPSRDNADSRSSGNGEELDDDDEMLEQSFSQLEILFSYHNSLMMVHRMAPTVPSGITSPAAAESSKICLASARISIQLINHAIVTNKALAASGMLLWLFQYYPFTAFFCLFSEIVRNPEAETAPADWELMRDLVRYLYSMRTYNEGARKLSGIARAFTAVAWGFLQGDGASAGKKRRKQGGASGSVTAVEGRRGKRAMAGEPPLAGVTRAAEDLGEGDDEDEVDDEVDKAIGMHERAEMDEPRGFEYFNNEASRFPKRPSSAAIAQNQHSSSNKNQAMPQAPTLPADPLPPAETRTLPVSTQSNIVLDTPLLPASALSDFSLSDLDIDFSSLIDMGSMNNLTQCMDLDDDGGDTPQPIDMNYELSSAVGYLRNPSSNGAAGPGAFGSFSGVSGIGAVRGLGMLMGGMVNHTAPGHQDDSDTIGDGQQHHSQPHKQTSQNVIHRNGTSGSSGGGIDHHTSASSSITPPEVHHSRDTTPSTPALKVDRSIGIGGIFAGYFGGAAVPSPPSSGDVIEEMVHDSCGPGYYPPYSISSPVGSHTHHQPIPTNTDTHHPPPHPPAAQPPQPAHRTQSPVPWRTAMLQAAKQGPLEFDWFGWDGGVSLPATVYGSVLAPTPPPVVVQSGVMDSVGDDRVRERTGDGEEGRSSGGKTRVAVSAGEGGLVLREYAEVEMGGWQME
ncbi:fungal-specific transcription factor domain-containing protein [Kalaharituber pfeilii]|nr:fungal-specific transcription factor domain-containing protein [Kalaharituber pfeilii]